jgi:hypothetical protein
MIKIPITLIIEAPDGATHYTGNLRHDPTWWKCRRIGIAGDHWFYWNDERGEWYFFSHYKPHWINEIVRD